jgi:hypothetical protein
VDGGKFVSQSGWTALMWAAGNGRADIARLLIDAGADKEARDNVRRRLLRCFRALPLFLILYFIFHLPLFFSLNLPHFFLLFLISKNTIACFFPRFSSFSLFFATFLYSQFLQSFSSI